MFYRWNRVSRIATAGAAAIIGITLAANTWALDACRTPTPYPCGVDGVCRPNAFSYGHYKTRWRPWPGEAKQLGATPDAADPGKGELELDPFEHPKPEDENLRGPAKTKKEKARNKAVEGEAAAEGTIEGLVQPLLEDGPLEDGPLPDFEQQETLPDFELQGYQDVMPVPVGDAPPALPQSLKRGNILQLGGQMSASIETQPQRPVRFTLATAPPEQPVRPAHLQATTSRRQPVVRANVDLSKPLQLVNPAAGNVVPKSNVIRPVYYEASDLPPSFPGR